MVKVDNALLEAALPLAVFVVAIADMPDLYND